jgi:AraC family transcriptional regulator, carnitine catabolism transcriptional activator
LSLTFIAIELAFYAMAPADVVFLLIQRFSMISLYGALEPLRIANRFAGKRFSWRFVSADGTPVSASNDIPISVMGSLADLGRPTMVVICASYEPERGITKPVLSAVRKLAAQKVLLAGIDTGPFVMARAGVLDGYRATCHWESLPGFRESFLRIQTMQSLYEVDRDRMTCAGGSSSIDMMLDWIKQQLGRGIAVTVADQLVHSRIAEQRGEARAPAAARYGTTDARLLACISLMEEQVEEPYDIKALAARAGVSVRQLERLFANALNKRPMGFYLGLRLERAERLINYSIMSVREVALATGFSSLPLFSRSFRNHFGTSPSKWRKK